MENKIIIIPEDTKNYVESLHYEVESRKDLLSFALSKGYKSNDSFKEYEKEYKEFFIQYEAAKKNIENMFVKKMYPNVIKWELNFETCEITINIPDN